MAKKERWIVFAVGIVLLALFTFTDLQISMAVATKPLWARVFEVVGEIPFTTLTIAACAILFRFRTRKNMGLNILCAVGTGALFLLFSLMGGFMTYNYLTDNLGEISMVWMVLPALLMAAVGIWIARIVPRGGFSNIYASFPSGHSMNSAGVILLMLLPPMIPALEGKERVLHALVYVWCAVVGISRVFMGAHFASDVTVGILLSLAIFEVLRAIFYRKASKAQN